MAGPGALLHQAASQLASVTRELRWAARTEVVLVLLFYTARGLLLEAVACCRAHWQPPSAGPYRVGQPLFVGSTWQMRVWGFFKRRFYGFADDLWNRPISGEAGSHVDVLLRRRLGRHDGAPLVLTGERVRCLNLASYNYLGFGGVEAHCTPAVEAALDAHGAGVGASRLECGHRPEHAALEAAVAAFLGKEAALVTGMGFATNSTVLPCLVDPRGDGRGVLVLSDALNHASIVEGVRVSGAAVWPFAHNDVAHLEVQLRRAMARGQPDGTPWRKMLIVVEGRAAHASHAAVTSCPHGDQGG